MDTSSKMDASSKYKTALILSGGGARFGYYLGMYAALCDMGKRPDVVIASCGGSFIAGLLALNPCPKAAKKMLFSRPFYDMLCRVTPVLPNKKTALLTGVFKRWFGYQTSKVANIINGSRVKNSINKPTLQALPFNILNDLNNNALFYIKNESEDNPLWDSKLLQNFVKCDEATNNSDSNKTYTTVKTLIVTSRGISLNSGFVWQQVLSTNDDALTKRLQQLQKKGLLTAAVSKHSKHISSNIYIDDAMPFKTAVRASVNDMYYLPPIIKNNHTLLGGAIDLLPIEIANKLADTVYAERKLPYDKWVAAPAIKTIFGFDANKRRADWHLYQPSDSDINWIDTTDNLKAIPPVVVRKPKPLAGYVDVRYPSYDEFKKTMQKQYDYGYKKVMQMNPSQ